jgi:hypothetical protein
MRAGDRVRLIGIPPNLPAGDPDLPTQQTFKNCLGQDFTVTGFNEIGWAELLIESVTGNLGETIWVETEFLKVIPK